MPARSMRHLTAVIIALALALAACAARLGPPPVVFPVGDPWTATFDEAIEGPLAMDGAWVFVATRDGRVTSVEAATGRVRWSVENRPGLLSAGEGLVVARGTDGTVWGLDPASGSAMWKVPSDITGPHAAAIHGGRVYVGGNGLMALDARTGRLLWVVQPKVEVTTRPAPHGPWLFTGEVGHGLVSRDAVTGVVRWSEGEGGAPVAPPVIDADGRVLYGTRDRRFLALHADKGGRDWRWKVGADVQTPAALVPGRVLFASNEAVLYALFNGGNMTWRAGLPSRPLSGPVLVDSAVLVACHGLRPSEGTVVGFDARNGKRLGDLRTPAEIVGSPLAVGRRVIVPLRNRTVMGYAMGVAPPPPSPTPSPSVAPSPGLETPVEDDPAS